MKSALFPLLLSLCFVLAACALPGRSTGPPAAAPYLATKFCGFVFDGRRSEARFSLDLTVGRQAPAGSALEVTFENPLERDRPLVVTRALQPGERELRVLSPPVKGITQREYAMVARLYRSADRKELLASHSETCRAPFGQGEFGIQYR